MRSIRLDANYGSRLEGACIVENLGQSDDSMGLRAIVNDKFTEIQRSLEVEPDQLLVLSLTGYLPHHSGISYGTVRNVLRDKDAAFLSPFIDIPLAEDSTLVAQDPTESYKRYVSDIALYLVKNTDKFAEIRIISSSLGGVVLSDVIRHINTLGDEGEAVLNKIRSIFYLNSPLDPAEITVNREHLFRMEYDNFDRPGWKDLYPQTQLERERLLEWLYEFIYHKCYRFPGIVRLNKQTRVTYVSTSLAAGLVKSDAPLYVSSGLVNMPKFDPVIRAVPELTDPTRESTIMLRGLGRRVLRIFEDQVVRFIAISPREVGTEQGHYVAAADIPDLLKHIRKSIED